jgi:acetyl/propionyl-CoA carboxylase alpha subunit
MPHTTIVLRDEGGTTQEVELKEDGTVSVGSAVIPVQRARGGETRAGDLTLWAAGNGNTRWVFANGRIWIFEVDRAGQPARARRQDGHVSAPMPATVVKILVKASDQVRAGDTVMILEAMKMELPVRAATDGIVRLVRCREGELVQPGQDLIELAPTPNTPTPNPPLATPKPEGA